MDDKKIKNYILINDLGGGGAERQVSHVLNLQEVERVFLLYRTVVYPIQENKVVFLFPEIENPGLWQKVMLFLKVPFRLRKQGVRAGDKLICFLQLPYLLGFVCKFILHTRLVICLRTSPFGFYSNFQGLKIPLFFYRAILKSAAEIIVNSRQSGEELVARWQMKGVRVIENGYDVLAIQKMANQSEVVPEFLQHYTVYITVGRLVHDKGQWHIIRVFAKLLETRKNLKMVIAGQGPLLQALHDLCLMFGLRSYRFDQDTSLTEDYDVYFIGFQKNPYAWIKASTVFLLPSLYEGLPNALIEALLLGKPAICSDCKTGPREILLGPDRLQLPLPQPVQSDIGILIPAFSEEMNLNTDALSAIENHWFEQMAFLLNHPEVYNQMQTASTQVHERYSLEPILNQWKNALS